MSNVILRTAVKLLVPLSLVFGVFVYFKGHQTPGGGFVAGLTVGLALLMLRMGQGPAAMKRLMPLDPPGLIVAGLALALLTGLGAMAMGLPLLTSAHGHVSLPGAGGHLEWASVMIFDLGVMLTVAGVVTGMIHALSQELEP